MEYIYSSMGLSTRDGKRFLGTNMWDGKDNLYWGWEKINLGKESILLQIKMMEVVEVVES